jgi:hypothetical protein
VVSFVRAVRQQKIGRGLYVRDFAVGGAAAEVVGELDHGDLSTETAPDRTLSKTKNVSKRIGEEKEREERKKES